MASGTNLTEIHPHQANVLFQKYLGTRSRRGKTGTSFTGKLFTKAGEPQTNTSGDSPGVAPAWIIDTSGEKLYFCNTWTDENTFNIVAVTPS